MGRSSSAPGTNTSGFEDWKHGSSCLGKKTVISKLHFSELFID